MAWSFLRQIKGLRERGWAVVSLWADELGAKCTSSVRGLWSGVFQNQTEQEVCQIVKESGVDLVQLHGDEDGNRLGAAAPAGVCLALRSCTLKWLAMRRARGGRGGFAQQLQAAKTSTGIVAEGASSGPAQTARTARRSGHSVWPIDCRASRYKGARQRARRRHRRVL